MKERVMIPYLCLSRSVYTITGRGVQLEKIATDIINYKAHY